MARPRKLGLDYFPLDVDFLQDEKVRILKVRFGPDGVMLYLYILCRIYREGYFLPWNDDTEYIVADELGMSHEKVRQVLKFLLERSLLESKLFQSDTIITSTGIQKRYQEAVKARASKAPITVIKDYWLLDENETASWIKVSHIASKSKKNTSKSEKNPGLSMEKLPKVKESKVKENYIDSTEPVPASAPKPEKAKEKSMIEIPLNNGSMWPVTETQYKEWCSLFPAVDILQELKKMYAWLDANKQRRKTARGIKAFCVRWLSSAQDNAGKYRGGAEQYKSSNRLDPMGNFEQRVHTKEELESLYLFANIPSEETEKNETNS